MKVTITCLIVALFWNIAATQQVTKYYSVRKDPPWLQISYIGDDTVPERTVINSTRRPLIRQVKPGYWQITFPPLP